MNRIIITVSPQSMRAFRLATQFMDGHRELEVFEIDLPARVTIPRPWNDLERRLANIAANINRLIGSENPGSWILAGPLSTLVHLVPLLKDSVKRRLGSVEVADLTALPAAQIAHRFAPASAAA